MKMLAEYLEKAINFEKMAGEQKDANLKANLEYLAVAYRKLADERATKLGLSKPPPKPILAQRFAGSISHPCRYITGQSVPIKAYKEI